MDNNALAKQTRGIGWNTFRFSRAAVRRMAIDRLLNFCWWIMILKILGSPPGVWIPAFSAAGRHSTTRPLSCLNWVLWRHIIVWCLFGAKFQNIIRPRLPLWSCLPSLRHINAIDTLSQYISFFLFSGNRMLCHYKNYTLKKLCLLLKLTWYEFWHHYNHLHH